jgi:hypothetical protein
MDTTKVENSEGFRTVTNNEIEDEFWDATTSWDMRIETPAELIDYVDNNVKACRFQRHHRLMKTK